VGGRDGEKSYKEDKFVSGGATSAEPEAANCTTWTGTPSPRPADGDGEVTSAALALGDKATYCPVSSPVPGTGAGVSTLRGTIANLRLSAAPSTLLLCLRLCTGAVPMGSFFMFFPQGNGDEGEESFEALLCRVLASDPVVLCCWPLS
jgi:hypothetical protein